MKKEQKKTIFIDGDACPVKEIIFQEAAFFGLPVRLITSFDHFTQQPFPANVQVQYVERGRDRVDFEILGMIQAGDCLVTQDYGLASLALEKGAYVYHHQGFAYEKQTINELLYQRYIMGEERKKTKRQKKIGALRVKETQDFQVFFHQQLIQITQENE